MRTTTIFLILSVFTIISCNQPSSKEIPKVLVSELDTFYLGNKLVNVEKVLKADFDKIITPATNSYEVEYLLKDSSVAKRIGDTLFLRVADRMVKFVNDTSNDDMFLNYHYLGFQRDIGQYVLSVGFSEESIYYLIGSKTGDTTIPFGRPVISPDKKYFICGHDGMSYYDLDINGFELYKNSPKPELISRRELREWGPSEIYWVDNSTLLVECAVADTTQEDGSHEEYFRLTWK